MYSYLENGNFVVKRTDLKKINMVASNMAFEQTVYRDRKSTCEVIWYTKNEKTLSRWLITRHLMTEYASKLENVMEYSNKTKELYGFYRANWRIAGYKKDAYFNQIRLT